MLMVQLPKNKYKGLLSCFTSILEEKQKSDAEEDGGTVSQEEGDNKPKAEVKGAGCILYFST